MVAIHTAAFISAICDPLWKNRPLAKKKSFTDKYKKKHHERFPKVNLVVCHCEKRHTPGCGCLSVAFMEKARNNFSFILSNSESAHEFAEALKRLPRHACDEHK